MHETAHAADGMQAGQFVGIVLRWEMHDPLRKAERLLDDAVKGQRAETWLTLN